MAEGVEHAGSIFDAALRRKRRQALATRPDGTAFLKREAAERLVDRLADIRRTFPLALDLGAHHGVLAALLAGSPHVGRVVSAESAPILLAAAEGWRVACDEERLPFREGAFDAALSVLSLHGIDDLPGCLIQLRRCLKPDGLLLAVLPGAETLIELRTCLADAEAERSGGVSPRVAPFVETRDAGALLQRAGFALPVVDRELLTLDYSSPLALMRELRAMGEANPLLARLRRFTRRDVLLRAAALYLERHGDGDGRVPATFEFLWMTAWAPAPSQPLPAARGSGRVPLGEALA